MAIKSYPGATKRNKIYSDNIFEFLPGWVQMIYNKISGKENFVHIPKKTKIYPMIFNCKQTFL